MNGPETDKKPERLADPPESAELYHYRIRFREGIREYAAFTHGAPLHRGELVMVHMEQGPEPVIVGGCLGAFLQPADKPACPEILRPATEDERSQYEALLLQEQEAFSFCQAQVARQGLLMSLVRVERFFDGSKMIFYFTAENRVDFRELVKVLVRQYHTRIEMRQIGVRHETQMLGGLGACGRPLCCATFLKVFDPVSIKMAKTQELPLNPAKISGNCNRLLCCLTYEYEQYKNVRRQMPKPRKTLNLNSANWTVLQQHPLTETLTVSGPDGTHKSVGRAEWQNADANAPPEDSKTGMAPAAGPPARAGANARPRHTRRRKPSKTRQE